MKTMNTMNIIKTLLSPIFIWNKQRKCKHDYRNKGFGSYKTSMFTSRERRCTKCKKIEYDVNYKLN